MIKVFVRKTVAEAEVDTPTTSGSVGTKATFQFSEEWDSLRKTAIFETDNYKEPVDIPESGEVEVPKRVLVYPWVRLRIGVRGESEDGSVIIPTVYADCGTINRGANTTPAGTPPTPSQAEQLQSQIDELRKGGVGGGITQETDPTVPEWAKNPTKPTYTAEEVGAIPVGTEVVRAFDVYTKITEPVVLIPEITLTPNLDGYVEIADETTPKLIAGSTYSVMWNGDKYTCVAQEADLPDLGGKVTVLGDINGDGTTPFVVVRISDEVAETYGVYAVIISSTGNPFTISITAEKIIPDVPTKVSELRNDAGYVTSMPTRLPNPYKLTFSGAVNAEYNGSEAVEVVIPQGGGGGKEWRLLADITTTEEVNKIAITEGIPNGVNGVYIHFVGHYVETTGYDYITFSVNEKDAFNANFNIGATDQMYDVLLEIHEDGTGHRFARNSNTSNSNSTFGLSYNSAKPREGLLPVTEVSVRFSSAAGLIAIGAQMKVWVRA